MSTNNERYELNKNLAQMLLWRWKEFRLTSALLVEFPV